MAVYHNKTGMGGARKTMRKSRKARKTMRKMRK